MEYSIQAPIIFWVKNFDKEVVTRESYHNLSSWFDSSYKQIAIEPFCNFSESKSYMYLYFYSQDKYKSFIKNSHFDSNKMECSLNLITFDNNNTLTSIDDFKEETLIINKDWLENSKLNITDLQNIFKNFISAYRDL